MSLATSDVCDEGGRRDALGPALGRWCGAVDAVGLALLTHAEGPVLDVGCGPGRLVVERWFDRVHVGVDAIAPPAAAGLRVEDTWCAGERWFASLTS